MPSTLATSSVVYARPAGRELRLHIVRPRDAVPRAVLLDIHGGAWTYFDHRVDFYWCEGLARRGYLVAAADFRLAPRDPWPAFLADLRAASRWLRAHAAELGCAEGPIGAIGGSTGGHLAALLALWPAEASHPATAAVDTGDDVGAHLDFAVPLWPILDVPGRYRMVTENRFDPIARAFASRVVAKHKVRATAGGGAAERMRRVAALRRRSPWWGARLGDLLQFLSRLGGRFPPTQAVLYDTLARAHEGAFRNDAEMQEASPLHHLRHRPGTHRPPLLIVQGQSDTNMTVAMTTAFVDEYRRQGGRVDLEFPPRLGHSYGNIPSAAADALIDRVDRFVRSVIS